MLLIFGDLMKAMWLSVLGVVSIARGTVATESAFCQASGFLVQFGTETSDYSVLAIAIHSALQVFRPSNQIRSDGLYPYRHQVYIGALVIPAAMSGLAFINPKWGYMSQGPFCSLPLRPFWYRLALAWIPRYLIAVIILGLAIAIYAHVGFEFRALAHSFQADKPSISTTTPMLSVRSAETGSVSMPAMSEYQISQFRRGSSVVSMIGASRRASVVASVGSQVTDFVNDTTHALAAPEGSNTVDRCYMLPPLQSYNTTSPTHQPTPNKDTKDLPPPESHNDNSPPPEAPESHMQQHLAQQHLRIHRQLRLMFIYPLAYVLVWLFPFINHCFTYSDAFARHPVYWLNLISTICITLMGAIDCLIFSLRERPWRHIAFSDGTFLGSFHGYGEVKAGDGEGGEEGDVGGGEWGEGEGGEDEEEYGDDGDDGVGGH
ncbi:hypothetical protein GRF29_154g1226769 [Pseudopithomyces chartarum]|uniref:G protein-coupled glucose receptor regulating Gpa2-domain-containing protein n=1 Tax=Pseudopithomyces chartarum TaxID=1892770 RepID=A0AAN6LVE5_9PLEO|nr:hypothetical protein GRF29_154g1226769 [Pseudopithomyces chartarum]